jgi:uncharacterized protein involved in exopolysaccharide biosynthesis
MRLELMPYGLLTVLFRHKRAVAATFLTVVLSGVGYLILATPKYESVAELIVRFGDRSIPDVSRKPVSEMTPADRREIVLSNAAIIKSHDLEQATIKKLGLDVIYPGIVADPPTRWTPMDEGVRVFDKNLNVDVGAIDNVITVSFLHPDKELASKILHTLIGLYIARQTAVYQNPQRDFLATEVKKAAGSLDKAQDALQQFKSRWRITDYDQEIQDLLKQRGDVDTNLQTARANLAQAQQRKADLAKLLRAIPATVPAPSSEKYRSVDDAETRLADLQAKRSQMLATYNANSPALATVEAGVATAQSELHARRRELKGRALSNVNTVHQTVQTDFVRASADVQGYTEPVQILQAQLKGINQRLNDLQSNRGKFDDLARVREIAETTYKTLSAQYEDARVKENLNERRISPATIISQPTLPYRTARPRKLVTVLASLFAASLLATGMALVLEALDDRFATAAQVAYALDLPVLAAFDKNEGRGERKFIAMEGLS